MAVRGTQWHAYGAKTGVTNAYVPGDYLELGAHASDADAWDVPYEAQFCTIEVKGATLAGGANALTFFLARDKLGDIPFMVEVVLTPKLGITTATKFGGSVSFETPYLWKHNSDDIVAGKVYMHMKWNAGTGDVVARLRGLQ